MEAGQFGIHRLKSNCNCEIVKTEGIFYYPGLYLPKEIEREKRERDIYIYREREREREKERVLNDNISIMYL